ncbi:MAG: S1C family serine protease [Ruminiclostridium sp.]
MEQNFYTQEPQGMQNMQTPEPEKKPRTKNGKLRTVIALVAAVAVVGGGAGFGGALLAGNMINTSSVKQNVTASYSLPDNSDEKIDPPSGSGDVSGALNAISSSNNEASAEKIYPSNVTPTGPNGTYTSQELYQAVNDTIVFIKVYADQSTIYNDYYDSYFGYGSRYDKKDEEPVYAGYGSGIVFTEDGYILTNAHLVTNYVKFVVEVNDYYDAGTTHEYEATVIGSDDDTDIAVLKIERDEPFIAAKLGDSSNLSVGQEVCAIGNPGVTSNVLFKHTMTKGIISGLDRVCMSEGYELSLIQIDAAINSGNSGGGLFDMYGNVVGVVSSKIIVDQYEGLGFAITINEAKPVMEDLLSYGYVKSRPVLGITTVELNEYRAQLYGTKLSQGLLVSSINDDAPVAKSGLQISDIITKINGTNVSTVSDVQSIIGKMKVGDTITATVARANERNGVDSIDIEIVLTESKS